MAEKIGNHTLATGGKVLPLRPGEYGVCDRCGREMTNHQRRDRPKTKTCRDCKYVDPMWGKRRA